MMARNEHDAANEKPAVRPTHAPAPPVAAKEGAPLPSSATALAEQLPTPASTPSDAERDQKAAQAKVEPLQKEYNGLLEQIRETVDPVLRAQLVLRKGNLTRKIDAIKRPARIA